MWSLQQVYASKLGLELGFSVPKMRVIDWSRGREWRAMKMKLSEFAENKYGQVQKNKVKKELDRGFFIVMEV